jgi:hypothetical protein
VQNEWRRETPTQVLNVDERPHGASESTIVHGEHYGLYFDFRYKRKIYTHFEVGVFGKIQTSAQISKEEGGFIGVDVYQLRFKFLTTVVFDIQHEGCYCYEENPYHPIVVISKLNKMDY